MSNSKTATPFGDAPCATITHGLGGQKIVPGKGASNQARGESELNGFDPSDAEEQLQSIAKVKVKRKSLFEFMVFSMLRSREVRNIQLEVTEGGNAERSVCLFRWQGWEPAPQDKAKVTARFIHPLADDGRYICLWSGVGLD